VSYFNTMQAVCGKNYKPVLLAVAACRPRAMVAGPLTEGA